MSPGDDALRLQPVEERKERIGRALIVEEARLAALRHVREHFHRAAEVGIRALPTTPALPRSRFLQIESVRAIPAQRGPASCLMRGSSGIASRRRRGAASTAEVVRDYADHIHLPAEHVAVHDVEILACAHSADVAAHSRCRASRRASVMSVRSFPPTAREPGDRYGRARPLCRGVA